MAWTDEMVEGLRQMWDEGLTANEIAKRLGVSKNSIVGKVHRLCLKARPSPIKRKDVVEEAVVDNVQEVVPETEVVETANGITFVNESAKRSAPYFNIIIDGITAITE
jgi:hypothetical protein